VPTLPEEAECSIEVPDGQDFALHYVKCYIYDVMRMADLFNRIFASKQRSGMIGGKFWFQE
jgi:hypothetical protein